jgi:hypothetical protein
MSFGRVACVDCKKDLPADFENAGAFLACPSCLSRLRVFAFPALRRSTAPVVAAPTMGVAEASCFYHAAKQAVVTCDSCGRFLCALCDVEIGSAHRCPSCLAAGKESRKLETVENRRILYDGLALALAILPILIWPATLLTAPAALYVVLRYWRTPLSILPRTRIRFVIAALLALAQIGGWALLFYFIIANARTAA